jgi:hypothetical protein
MSTLGFTLCFLCTAKNALTWIEGLTIHVLKISKWPHHFVYTQEGRAHLSQGVDQPPWWPNFVNFLWPSFFGGNTSTNDHYLPFYGGLIQGRRNLDPWAHTKVL